jgi:hypothetical protein
MAPACQKALAVDLIVKLRLERILSEALKYKALPAMASRMPSQGHFARHGNAFAIGNDNSGNHGGDHSCNQNEKGIR